MRNQFPSVDRKALLSICIMLIYKRHRNASYETEEEREIFSDLVVNLLQDSKCPHLNVIKSRVASWLFLKNYKEMM